MNYGYVYKTVNLTNGKVYIGQHKESAFNSRYAGSGHRLQRAVDKYGKIYFKVELITFASSKEKLDELERYYIAEARRLLSSENVYNLADGGEGYGGLSGENSPHWGKKRTEESRIKQSKAVIGDKNHFYGRHHSEKTKNKIREAIDRRPSLLVTKMCLICGNSFFTKPSLIKIGKGKLCSAKCSYKYLSVIKSGKSFSNKTTFVKGNIPWNKGKTAVLAFGLS